MVTMEVWTTRPNDVLNEAAHLLFRRGESEALIDALWDGRFNGERVLLTGLSQEQLSALKEAAERLGLWYEAGYERRVRLLPVR